MWRNDISSCLRSFVTPVNHALLLMLDNELENSLGYMTTIV